MVVLAVLVVLLAVALGTATLLVLWPLAAVTGAVLYCLDRRGRRAVWPVAALVLISAGIVYRIAGWSPSLDAGATAAVVAGPVVLAGLIVAGAGGPARITARRERAEQRRRLLRAARLEQRRDARRAAIKQRTGLDVDLLSEVSRERASRLTRAVGSGITRRLERHRARREPESGERWLDLDRDVSADLSKRRGDEIRDLADELDRTRER